MDLPLNSLKEFLCYSHLTRYVNSEWKERGGVFIVAPGESLKTSVLQILSEYRGSLLLSDSTCSQLDNLTDDFRDESTSSLVFLEYQKLYERGWDTARNVEARLKNLVAEGSHMLSFGQDAQSSGFKVRCMVFGAMTDVFFRKNFKRWREDQFLRRFIWIRYAMKHSDIINEAIIRNQKIDFGAVPLIEPPASRSIPYTTLSEEASKIERLMRGHTGKAKAIPLQLMCKVLSVMKWAYKRRKKDEHQAWKELQEFCGICWGGEDARLTIDLNGTKKDD